MASAEPGQEGAFAVQEDGDEREHLQNHRRRVLHPLNWRVPGIHVTLDERVGDDRLRLADVRPTAAKRIAGDLRHGEEMEDRAIEVEQAPGREVRDDVVVEDGRQERRAQ